MKKEWIVALTVVLLLILLILLFPIPYAVLDGGSWGLKSFTWEYTSWHSVEDVDSHAVYWRDGHTLKIFGQTVSEEFYSATTPRESG